MLDTGCRMDDVGCRKMGWLDDWMGIGRAVPLKAGDLKPEIGLRVASPRSDVQSVRSIDNHKSSIQRVAGIVPYASRLAGFRRLKM